MARLRGGASVAAHSTADQTAMTDGTGRDPHRKVIIAALQTGERPKGTPNPGCEANFTLLANLARKAAPRSRARTWSVSLNTPSPAGRISVSKS